MPIDQSTHLSVILTDVTDLDIKQSGNHTVTLWIYNDESVITLNFSLLDPEDVDTLLAFGRQWVEVMTEAVPDAQENL